MAPSISPECYHSSVVLTFVIISATLVMKEDVHLLKVIILPVLRYLVQIYIFDFGSTVQMPSCPPTCSSSLMAWWNNSSAPLGMPYSYLAYTNYNFRYCRICTDSPAYSSTHSTTTPATNTSLVLGSTIICRSHSPFRRTYSTFW